MKNFTKNYRKNFEQEAEQFFFLCNAEDAQKVFTQYKKEKLEDIIRLSYISLVLGYRKLFLRLLKEVGKDQKEFLKRIKKVNKNFEKINDWMNDFIDNIKHREEQNIVREYWEEQKLNIDPTKSIIKQLIRNTNRNINISI